MNSGKGLSRINLQIIIFISIFIFSQQLPCIQCISVLSNSRSLPAIKRHDNFDMNYLSAAQQTEQVNEMEKVSRNSRAKRFHIFSASLCFAKCN